MKSIFRLPTCSSHLGVLSKSSHLHDIASSEEQTPRSIAPPQIFSFHASTRFGTRALGHGKGRFVPVITPRFSPHWNMQSMWGASKEETEPMQTDFHAAHACNLDSWLQQLRDHNLLPQLQLPPSSTKAPSHHRIRRRRVCCHRASRTRPIL